MKIITFCAHNYVSVSSQLLDAPHRKTAAGTFACTLCLCGYSLTRSLMLMINLCVDRSYTVKERRSQVSFFQHLLTPNTFPFHLGSGPVSLPLGCDISFPLRLTHTLNISCCVPINVIIICVLGHTQYGAHIMKYILIDFRVFLQTHWINFLPDKTQKANSSLKSFFPLCFCWCFAATCRSVK